MGPIGSSGDGSGDPLRVEETSRPSLRRRGYPCGVDNYWVAVLWAILPTIVVSLTFYLILRGVLRMDRTERKAYARVEAQERAKRGLPPVAPTTETSSR